MSCVFVFVFVLYFILILTQGIAPLLVAYHKLLRAESCLKVIFVLCVFCILFWYFVFHSQLDPGRCPLLSIYHKLLLPSNMTKYIFFYIFSTPCIRLTSIWQFVMIFDKFGVKLDCLVTVHLYMHSYLCFVFSS